MRQKRESGSFTIEAAIIVPFYLFLMITVLQMGITFYQDCVSREILQEWKDFRAVSMFYGLQWLEEAGEEVLKGE